MHYTIITADDRKEGSPYRAVRNIPTGDTPKLLKVLFLDIDMRGGDNLHIFTSDGASSEEKNHWASILEDEDLEH